MDTIDKIIFEVFRTLPDEQQYEIVKKIAIDNKKLREKSEVKKYAYLVQDKNTLINHGLFTSQEIAEKYVQGNSEFAIQKCPLN
jgi:hypothetical protein